jgi:hypothetical protein
LATLARCGDAIPNKIPVDGAEAVDHARQMRGKGMAAKSTTARNELVNFNRALTIIEQQGPR